MDEPSLQPNRLLHLLPVDDIFRQFFNELADFFIRFFFTHRVPELGEFAEGDRNGDIGPALVLAENYAVLHVDQGPLGVIVGQLVVTNEEVVAEVAHHEFLLAVFGDCLSPAGLQPLQRQYVAVGYFELGRFTFHAEVALGDEAAFRAVDGTVDVAAGEHDRYADRF